MFQSNNKTFQTCSACNWSSAILTGLQPRRTCFRCWTKRSPEPTKTVSLQYKQLTRTDQHIPSVWLPEQDLVCQSAVLVRQLVMVIQRECEQDANYIWLSTVQLVEKIRSWKHLINTTFSIKSWFVTTRWLIVSDAILQRGMLVHKFLDKNSCAVELIQKYTFCELVHRSFHRSTFFLLHLS